MRLVKVFDQKTVEHLGYYVYILVDPRDRQPFYIGKGIGNRVFAHLGGALEDIGKSSLKYDLIRELHNEGFAPEHYIVRHGLDENTSFEIEASLIDTLQFMKYRKTNIVGGHNSLERGMMTTDEVVRLYNAVPLESTTSDCVVININRKYKRGFTDNDIYEATRASWVISKLKIPSLRYVLSEYKGLITEVFEVDRWYEVEMVQVGGKNAGNLKTRWNFDGHIAPQEIRNKYMNKSVAHHKKKGMASPIVFLWSK